MGKFSIALSKIGISTDGKFEVPVINVEASEKPQNRASYKDIFVKKNALSPFAEGLEDLKEKYSLGVIGGLVCAPGEYAGTRKAMEGAGVNYGRALKFYRVNSAEDPALVWKVVHAYAIAAGIVRYLRGEKITAYGNDLRGFAEITAKFPGLAIPRNAREAWVHTLNGVAYLEYVTVEGFSGFRRVVQREYLYDNGDRGENGPWRLGPPEKTRLVGAAQRHNLAQMWAVREGLIETPRLIAPRELTAEEEVAAVNGENVPLVDTGKLSGLIQHNYWEVARVLATSRPVVVMTGEWFLPELQTQVWTHVIHNAGYGWGVSAKAAKMCSRDEDYIGYLEKIEGAVRNADNDEDDFEVE